MIEHACVRIRSNCAKSICCCPKLMAPNLHGVKAFANAVQKFDDSRKKVVTEMGFGGLLSVPLTFLPRKFSYWLLTRVMGDGSITFGDEYVLPLSPVQVECVLGIPMGLKAVPSSIPESKEVEHRRILELYGKGDRKGDNISLANALGALIRTDKEGNVLPLLEEEKANFKVAFLIVALGYILCATTNTSYLGVKLILALLVYDETEEYDWCTFVFNWMVVAARNFQKKFARDGYVAGSCGCILFVLIFYLDHLGRVPMSWGLRPRFMAWSQDKINESVAADKKDFGDFGKLPSLNIAAGEEHPLTPRDYTSKERVVKVDVEESTQQVDVENIMQQAVDRMMPKVMSVIDMKLADVFQSMNQLMSQCTSIANAHKMIVGKPIEKEVAIANAHKKVVGGKPIEKQVVGHMNEEVSGEEEKDQVNQVGKGVADELEPVDLVGATDGPGDKNQQAEIEQPGALQLCDTFVPDLAAIAVNVEDVGAIDSLEEGGSGMKDVEMDEEAGWGDDLEDEDNGLVVGGEVVLGLLGTRGTRVLVDRSDETNNSSSDGEEYATEVSGDGTANKRVVKPTTVACSSIYTKASDTRRHTSFETRMLQYVRKWKELNDPLCPGLVLIACDNVEANQRECFTVVHPRARVGSQYVRMASVLYTKLWATTEFVNRSKRIMLDPSFAL